MSHGRRGEVPSQQAREAPGQQAYESPMVRDLGGFRELTAGCVGGPATDALVGADKQAFPANSGLFCSTS
jgi:hypothetical protein